VAGLRSRKAQARALELLADALLEQGRYDEALRSYEAALHAAPGFRRPYRGMTELVLRQGHDPARALEYVENIVGPSGPTWNRWTENGQAIDDYWSLKAWALAELGRGAEVAPAVAEAIRKTNPKSKPDLAATWRRLGMAMQAMGRQAEADEYLKKARDADPHGRWSALARATSGERSVEV
jgi:tetratricopeptide (TPR) repeat protein